MCVVRGWGGCGGGVVVVVGWLWWATPRHTERLLQFCIRLALLRLRSPSYLVTLV